MAGGREQSVCVQGLGSTKPLRPLPPLRPHRGTEGRTTQDPDCTWAAGLTDDSGQESHLHSGDLTLFVTSAGPLACAGGLGLSGCCRCLYCLEDRRLLEVTPGNTSQG